MTVTKNNFNELVRVEQVRNIESSQGKALTYASLSDMDNPVATDFKYSDFTQRLSKRAGLLIHENRLEAVLKKPGQHFRHASLGILLIALVLGGLAAGNAVSDLYTLNIYWLLTVLLGFNLISLVLWFVGISFRIQSLSSGLAAQLASWIPFRKKDEETYDSLSSNAWWDCCLSGRIGKWRISVLTHQFWLTYLVAGLILLILLMMAKQYNFVWGTTLLPESSLPKLTEALGRPLESVGMRVPDSEQITSSRMGEGKQTAETRAAWAQFLIGVLFIYGVLPRVILMIFSMMMLKWSEQNFRLDLYLPYYIDLRQRLMARKSVSKVIDADPMAGVKIVDSEQPHETYSLPINAHALGVELDNQIHWPGSISAQLNIIDMQSMEDAVDWVKTLKGSLIIGVAAYRLPDRGIQRMIRELTHATQCEPWLLLLNKNPAVPVNENRELAWFRLAEICEIPAEHVVTH